MIKYISIFRLVLRCLLVARKENSTGFSTCLTAWSKNLDPTGRSTRPVSISGIQCLNMYSRMYYIVQSLKCFQGKFTQVFRELTSLFKQLLQKCIQSLLNVAINEPRKKHAFVLYTEYRLSIDQCTVFVKPVVPIFVEH